jgi:hypothetical protein
MPSAENFLSLPDSTRSNIVAFTIVIVVSNMIFPGTLNDAYAQEMVSNVSLQQSSNWQQARHMHLGSPGIYTLRTSWQEFSIGWRNG